MSRHPMRRALHIPATAAQIDAALAGKWRARVVASAATVCAGAAARVFAGAVVVGLLATGLAASPAAAAGEGIAWTVETADNDRGTDRANYEFEVDPGDVVDDAFVVVNTGSDPLDLGAYAADAFTTTAGILDLRLADDPAEDSGAWITLSRTAVTLQPGERAEVGFRITVPENAAPGDHPAGVVTSLLTQTAGSSLSVDRRLGIRVHLRVAGEMTPAVEVTDVETAYAASWNPFDGGELTIAYTLRNTGNTRVAAMDAVTASGPFGLGALPASPESVPEVLPGSEVRVERTLPGVAALGWIAGSVIVSPQAVGIGAASLDPVALDVSVAAVPWALLVVLVALLIVGGVIAVVVVRHRRTRPDGEPAAT